MENPRVYIVIFSDVEPDTSEINGISLKLKRLRHSFLGVENVVPKLSEFSKSFSDSFGCHPRFTWCLRADADMLENCGSYDFMFKEFKGIWNGCRLSGDEIGWHPHPIFFDKKLGLWRHSTKKSLVKDMLKAARSKIPKVCSVRLGLNYMDDNIMGCLEGLGLKVDGSSLPGVYQPFGNADYSHVPLYRRFSKLVRPGDVNSLTIDWRQSPGQPYHPSLSDYRKKGCGKILEVPMTMIKARHPVSKSWYLAPWNIFFHQSGVEESFSKIFLGAKEKKVPFFLAGYFHPTNGYDIISKNTSVKRSLYLRIGSRYLGIGMRYAKEHFDLLSKLSKHYKVDIEYVTASKALSIYEGLSHRP